MADSRAKDLVKRVVSSLSDLTGVYLWSDKDGDSDAKSIEITDILSSDTIEHASDIDFKAITPAAFAKSLMTFDRNGVGRYATTGEIQGKTSDGLLKASNQVTMQTQWKTDWFRKSGAENVYYQSDYAVKSFFVKTIPSMSAGDYVQISPNITLPSPAYYTSIVGANVDMLITSDTFGLGQVWTNLTPGNWTDVNMGTTARFQIILNADSNIISLKSICNCSNLRISADLKFIF